MDGGYGSEFYLIPMIMCVSICLVRILLNSVENKLQMHPRGILLHLQMGFLQIF